MGIKLIPACHFPFICCMVFALNTESEQPYWIRVKSYNPKSKLSMKTSYFLIVLCMVFTLFSEMGGVKDFSDQILVCYLTLFALSGCPIGHYHFLFRHGFYSLLVWGGSKQIVFWLAGENTDSAITLLSFYAQYYNT